MDQTAGQLPSAACVIWTMNELSAIAAISARPSLFVDADRASTKTNGSLAMTVHPVQFPMGSSGSGAGTDPFAPVCGAATDPCGPVRGAATDPVIPGKISGA